MAVFASHGLPRRWGVVTPLKAATVRHTLDRRLARGIADGSGPLSMEHPARTPHEAAFRAASIWRRFSVRGMSGRHKVFLGMAAGVGKTFRMLQEGRAELEAGRDVVIGYLEPHGRVETEAQATGLPRLARRRITYKDMPLEEMDLPGLLERKPELALIDELAHTNAPTLEHGKRYEDIADVLAAGIDVYSTVNVQHLESLNDQVAELTGVRVRETFPDSVLSEADEVVLVDLTPSALIDRLRAGKVYPAARVPAALNGFFRVENLEALREVALRQVAEDVEAKRLKVDVAAPREDRLMEAAAPVAVGERLLALVTPQPSSQRIIRRAWRSAQRLGAALDVLIVLGREPSEAEREQIEAFRRLGSLLGADVLVEQGDDVPEVAARVAGERGSTYVLIGRPATRRGLGRLSEPLTDRLLRALPGIDVRIVADRSKRRPR
jgi:two-component system sensor histidine kinase KdpD